MADHWNTNQCLVSPNPFVQIDERNDKEEVEKFNRGELLHIYRKYV